MEMARQRKTHTKSRHGCVQCKDRRIKCDESKPRCGQCELKSFKCSLELITPAASSVLALDSPRSAGDVVDSSSVQAAPVQEPAVPAQLSLYPSGYSQKDLQLFHHFLSVTSLTLTCNHPQRRVVYKSVIGQLACSNDGLMRNVLSLSAIHLARLKPENKPDLLNTAIGLQNTALVHYRQQLQCIDKDNCHALLACCIILNCFMCALLPRYLEYSADGKYVGMESKSPSSIHQSLLRWIYVLRGTSPVIGAAWDWLRVGPLSPFLQYPELEGIDGLKKLSDLTTAFQPRCLVELDSHWKAQRALGQIPADEAQICLDSLAKLRAIYTILALSRGNKAISEPETALPNETERTDIALAWYVLAPQEFFPLLDQGKPRALVLLAYSGALMIGSTNWWTEHLGQAVVFAVARLLQAWHGDELDDLMKWPLQQCFQQQDVVSVWP